MKKFFIVLLALFMTSAVFVGCSPTQNDSKADIAIYMPDGAPALSLASVMNETTIAGHKVTFTVVPSEGIASYLLNETADIAIVPTNAAATVFNKSKPYKFAAATSHGNLFVVGKSEASSVADLKGKVVGVIGQGKVPDLIMQAILKRNNIEMVVGEVGAQPTEGKVTFVYTSDGGTLMPLIKQGKVDYGVLGEPAVTMALKNIEGSMVALDVQQLWGEDNYPQAGIVVKNTVSDEFITELFNLLEERSSYAQTNPNEALERISSNMLEGSSTTISVLTADTVQRCNIYLKRASLCKQDVLDFLTAFYELNAASVGGKMVGDEFFRAV